MTSNLLTEIGARDLVETYMKKEGELVSTQELLDSNVVPRLKGYRVKPGKVSDSIFGGQFVHKTQTYENPSLRTKNDSSLRLMVRTPRISTHDKNRGVIPFKDQILALNHNYMRKSAAEDIGTSQYEVEGLDDNSVVIAAENLKQIMFENVIRAYMAKSSTSTSLYQHYVVGGKREFCGHILPENLITNGILFPVLNTPSTKAKEDESISPSELIKRGICSSQQYNEIAATSLRAFGRASEFLETKGLILVDTKLEHGINRGGKIVSQDEIFTLDSSRLWLTSDYAEQVEKLKWGEIDELKPKSFSKEFARGFSKGDSEYTEEERIQIAVRYIIGIQHLLGKRFEPDMRPYTERVISGLETAVQKIAA